MGLLTVNSVVEGAVRVPCKEDIQKRTTGHLALAVRRPRETQEILGFVPPILRRTHSRNRQAAVRGVLSEWGHRAWSSESKTRKEHENHELLVLSENFWSESMAIKWV